MSNHLEFFCESCGEHLRVPGATPVGQAVECPYCHQAGRLPKAAILSASAFESGQAAASFPEPLYPLNRISARDCFSKGLSILGTNFLLFVIAFVVIAALDSFPGIMNVAEEGDVEVSLQFSGLILGLVSTFLTIGVMRTSLHAARGGRPDTNMLVSGGPYFLRVFLGRILFWIVAVLGLICFILPGLYFMVTYWSYDFFIIDQNCGIIESFRRARIHSTGNRWAILRVAILSILTFIAGGLCLGVGLFIAIPIVALMWTAVYLSMTGQPVTVATPLTSPAAAVGARMA